MLDCGIHPGFSGMNALPFFDEIDLDTVDVMLVTHFHLDHCAAVPYVVGKTNFKATPQCLNMTQAASSGTCNLTVLCLALSRLRTCFCNPQSCFAVSSKAEAASLRYAVLAHAVLVESSACMIG